MPNAQLAELVDALVSGTSVRKYVKVRVLYWAQAKVVSINDYIKMNAASIAEWSKK